MLGDGQRHTHIYIDISSVRGRRRFYIFISLPMKRARRYLLAAGGGHKNHLVIECTRCYRTGIPIIYYSLQFTLMFGNKHFIEYENARNGN